MNESSRASALNFSPNLLLHTTMPGDAAAVVALEESSFGEAAGTYAAEHEFSCEAAVEDLLRNYIMQPDSLHLTAKANGAVVGLAGVAVGFGKLPSDTGQISLLVHRDWRGRGVGTSLMTALLERTTENSKIKRLSLWVLADNGRAIDFYLRFGFKVTGRVSDNDRGRLLMSRLTPGYNYAEQTHR